MENFKPQEYRDQLAEDLKDIPDHQERAAALELEKGSFRYDKAKILHQEDIKDKHEGIGTDPLKTFPKFFNDSKMESLLEQGKYKTKEIERGVDLLHARTKMFEMGDYYILLVDYMAYDKSKGFRAERKVLEVVLRSKDGYEERKKKIEYWEIPPENVEYEDWTRPNLEVVSIGQDSFNVEIRAQSDNRRLGQDFYFDLQDKKGFKEIK